MTPQELKRLAQKYLDETPAGEHRALQKEINDAFLEMYCADPRLTDVKGDKEWWAKIQIGAFTAGWVKCMDRKKKS